MILLRGNVFSSLPSYLCPFDPLHPSVAHPCSYAPALSVMGYVILSNRKTEGRSLWLQVCSVFPERASLGTRQILPHVHPISIPLLVQKAETRGIQLIYVLKVWEPTIADFLPIQARHICKLFYGLGCHHGLILPLAFSLLWNASLLSLAANSLTSLFLFPAYQNSISGQPSRVSTEPREFEKWQLSGCSVHSTERININKTDIARQGLLSTSCGDLLIIPSK